MKTKLRGLAFGVLGTCFFANLACAQDGLADGGKPTAAAADKTALTAMAAALPAVWRFRAPLSADVQAGSMTSPAALSARCRGFYTAERMAQIEAIVPGWPHMASYDQGKTLWHINMAMVALLQLDEYRAMSPSQQTVQQWSVFLHDLAKEPEGGRAHRPSLRSATLAGRIMPQRGCPVTAA